MDAQNRKFTFESVFKVVSLELKGEYKKLFAECSEEERKELIQSCIKSGKESLVMIDAVIGCKNCKSSYIKLFLEEQIESILGYSEFLDGMGQGSHFMEEVACVFLESTLKTLEITFQEFNFKKS